jgi:HAD superfamily hydrolase (TIGR01459 family)
MTLSIPSLKSILHLFDAFLIDQYGVLHNGSQAFFGINSTLLTLKNNQKPIIMISNSGRSAKHNIKLMDSLSIHTNLIDHVITSGDCTLPILSNLAKKYTHTPLCFSISNENNHKELSACGVNITHNPENTDIVFLAGIDNYENGALDIQPLLPLFLKNNALMLCANPDIHGITSNGDIRDGPGKVALQYQNLGGKVIRTGKPDTAIFQHALSLLPSSTTKERTLMIGDSLEHDILGGYQTHIPTLLVASGIHKNQLNLPLFNPLHAPQPYDHEQLAHSCQKLCSQLNTPAPTYISPLFIA